jgi:cobalt-zinc-cadmium efflux system outer membrane protein
MRRSIVTGVFAGVTYAGVIQAQGATSQLPLPMAARDSLRLTREQAIAMALAGNPQLEIAREQTAQFRALQVQARAFPDPAVTASLDQQPGLFRSAGGGEKNVGAGISIPFPDKFRLRNNVAAGDVGAAQASYVALRTQIAAQTANTYDSLLLAIRHQRDIQNSKALADDFLRRTQARFEAGTVPRLDVIKASVDVAKATNDLISNERDIANARSSLARLLGVPLGSPVSPVDTLGIPGSLPDLETLERVAAQNRAELTAIAAQRRGAGSATTLAREFWLPDITLGVSRDVSPGTPPAVFSTGIAFPFPLFFWQHTSGEIAQAQHRERELAATERDIRAAIGEDVRTSYATATAALRQVIYLRDQLLPAAREAFRAASASYAIGGSSAFEVIDARRTLLDAESQYSDALAEANTSRSELERSIGVRLDSLTPSTVNAK